MTESGDAEAAWLLYARRLGDNLQRFRWAVGLSQERVAHEAGISTFTYQKLEKGESNPGTPANPRLRTVVMIARALGVPVLDLLPPFPADAEARRQESGSAS